jgi:hypothetical protein
MQNAKCKRKMQMRTPGVRKNGVHADQLHPVAANWDQFAS